MQFKCLEGLSLDDVRVMSPEEVKFHYGRMAEESQVEAARKQLLDALEVREVNVVKLRG